MNNINYQNIIRYAHELTENSYAFEYGTLFLKAAKIKNIDLSDETTYTKLDSCLKGIRQDYNKILVAMNAIEKIQKHRLNNSFEYSYDALIKTQDTDELSCWIDYIFTRYRSILDYIYQLVDICVSPQLGVSEKNDYNNIKKQNTKTKFLLKHISSKIDSRYNSLLNIKTFEKIVNDRDYLVHDCASVLVFSDCRDLNKSLTFKVWKKNSLDEDDTEITDSFYCLENNIVDYKKYWGLYLSVLIIFFDTIFSYLKNYCEIDPINLINIEYLCKSKRNNDDSVDKLPSVQDAFRDILGELLS